MNDENKVQNDVTQEIPAVKKPVSEPVPTTPEQTQAQPIIEEAQVVTEVQPVNEIKEEVKPEPVQPVITDTSKEEVPTPVAEPAPVAQDTPVQPTVEPVAAEVTQPAAEPAPVEQPAPVQPAPVQPTPVTTIDGSVVVENSQNSGIQTSDHLSSLNSGDVSSVGFVPTGEVIKKKPKKGIVITIVLLVLVILGLVGYFIIYPFIVKTYLSKPKNVYKETITYMAKEVSDVVTTPIHDKGIYDISVGLDTNINQLSKFSGYTYGVNLGVDPNSKNVQYGLYIKDPTGTENSFYNYLKDGKNYQRFSDYDKLVYIGELKDSYSSDTLEGMLGNSFNEILTQRKRVSGEDTKYLIDKVRDLLINSLDEDKLYKDDASINIDGTNLKVLAHHYNMDFDNQVRTREYLLNGILNDDKSLEIISTMLSVEKEEITEEIEELLKSSKEYEKQDSDIDYDIVIYTEGLKNDVIGYAINTKNNGSIHYYSKGNYIELYINNKVESLETEESKDVVLKAVGKKNGTIKVTYDDKDIANLTIRSLDKKKIDLDYEVIIEEDGKYTGIFKFTEDTNAERSKYDIDFSLSINGENINIKAKVENDWTYDVADINTKAAVNMTDYELQSRHSEFIKSLSNTPIGMLFQTTDGLNDPSINDYYTQRNLDDINNVCNNLDYNGNYVSEGISCTNGMCDITNGDVTETINCLN